MGELNKKAAARRRVSGCRWGKWVRCVEARLGELEWKACGEGWLGDEGSNLDSQLQSLPSYH